MVKLVVGFCAIFAVFLGWVVASFYCDMDPYKKIASATADRMIQGTTVTWRIARGMACSKE
jgi:hypothetical protein